MLGSGAISPRRHQNGAKWSMDVLLVAQLGACGPQTSEQAVNTTIACSLALDPMFAL
jgi:hypothetical protein